MAPPGGGAPRPAAGCAPRLSVPELSGKGLGQSLEYSSLRVGSTRSLTRLDGTTEFGESPRIAHRTGAAEGGRCAAARAPAPASVSGAAWAEEQRFMESRLQQLVDEVRVLEAEKLSADARASWAASGRGSGGPLAGAAASLLREREELQGQLRAAEVSRSAAEQRAATSEAALERTLGDLSARRRRAAAAAAPPSPGAEEDVEALRNEVVGATATLGEMTATLSRKEQLVEKSDREHSEVKRERDALASANESLRKEVEQLRGQIDAEEHSAKGAEAELSQLWAQLQRHEVEFARDMEELKKKAWSTEDALRQCRAALDECESSAEAFRGEGAELRSSVVAARASLARAEAEEEDAAAGRRRELAALGLRERELRPGRTRLLARLDGLVGEAEQLRQQDADRAARAELGQAEAAEECAGRAAALRAREAEAAEVERRVAELMQHMQEQRRENSELACEVSIAREAAAEVGRAPWAAARPPGAPAGCRAAAALQAQREVDLLQRWKSEALSVLGRMQGDMSAAQEQYRQQLRRNQELQGQLELLGRSARATLACPASARAQALAAPPPAGGAASPGAAPAAPPRQGAGEPGGGAPLRGPDVPERPAAAAPGPAPQGAAAAACLPAGALAGPDVPELPGAGAEAGRFTMSLPDAYWTGDQWALAPSGPVDGPFYSSFRARQGLRVPRALAQRAGRRRARSASPSAPAPRWAGACAPRWAGAPRPCGGPAGQLVGGR